MKPQKHTDIPKSFLVAVALCEELHSILYQDGCGADMWENNANLPTPLKELEKKWIDCKKENDFGKTAYKIYWESLQG